MLLPLQQISVFWWSYGRWRIKDPTVDGEYVVCSVFIINFEKQKTDT